MAGVPFSILYALNGQETHAHAGQAGIMSACKLKVAECQTTVDKPHILTSILRPWHDQATYYAQADRLYDLSGHHIRSKRITGPSMAPRKHASI
ncbi:hypothetical protein RvY_09330 [Ramazzottius varieornatus]|uniref:Uncharacterized protein n=1 Tax=Ramazzottius varieornatus TaxID=947166 RepID=A0A1D1VB63_RAMVA|nr:hypothetical protein RvY_09330 [Ramazzottius varieornatus]